MRPLAAFLLALSFARPLAAQPLQNPLTFVHAGQWAEAYGAAVRMHDGVAQKLIDYLRMLAPNAAGAAEIDAFMRDNPDWPMRISLMRRRQEAIVAEPNNATLGVLCAQTEPVVGAGLPRGPVAMPARGAALLRCADALATLGHAKEAATLAHDAWVSVISDAATEAAFNRRFPGMMTAADQWARFQRLAWDDVPAAQRQIPRLDPAHATQAATRLAMKSNVIGPIGRPEEDPGAVIDLARAYRKLGQDAAAVALWRSAGPAAQQAATDHLAAFWTERQYLARQLLRDGDAQGAYEVAAGHGQTESGPVAEAEFLSGFIALRRLNNPASAARHFSAVAAASPAVLTQSRAAYWLGRTAAAMGGDATADYKRAAGWPMTFYGQLADRAIGLPPLTLVGELRAAATPGADVTTALAATELARAAVLLIAWGDARHARPFLLRMEELARTPGARIAVGDYANSLGFPDVTVIVTRRLGRDGIMPPLQGWPVPVEPPLVPEPAVSLGIMRQESNFDIGIISSSGARGLMQLMPATARLVAHRLGEPTSNELLTSDSGHNMRMGTAYLQEMLEKFDNSVPLAAAAYNAGPHRVEQWLAENGDPRAGNQSMIDWIELIPFTETRNYVQRVLENVVVYQARLNSKLPPAMAQWSR